MGFKRVLLLDGLHCGSIWSIMPYRYEWVSGGESKVPQKQIRIANPIQRKLYAEWIKMITEMTNIHTVIYLGEGADGIDKKSGGKYQWTSDLSVQASCAANLLDMIKFKDKKRFYVVQGSNYHVEANLSADEQLARYLNAEYGTDLLLDIGGIVFHVCHFIGAAKSSLETEIDLCLSYPQNGHVDIIVRGHKHNFKYAGKRGVLALQLPSWKAKEDFSRRLGFKYMPQMGYVWVDIYDDGHYEWDSKTFYMENGKMDRIVVK